MRELVLRTMLTGAGFAGLASLAGAAEILVTTDIAVSTTWTNNNTYNLQDQIYVLPGATLTIEPGTVIASTTNIGGSLAVAKGAKIIAQGTKDAPIIFTSKADVATWAPDAGHPTGGNPTTGSWREAANEWGNLTLMGAGYISEDQVAGNSETCDPNNQAPMEGLVPDFAGDTKVLYGGGNDMDDSGTLAYVSIRYGGKVIALNNELNGLSLGGIGSETDIHHVEIMNNVDDGMEIWGGCVNLRNIAIWNVGDDSLDIDQGYRGKIQYGLIVQGWSLDASQGSGVGDNCIEHDGAEDSDWQPCTRTVIYNMTVIGQPVDGDGGTAWRDNACVQHRNSIFMELGEQLVRFDNSDGDNGSGYGHNGTLDWAGHWTTDWDSIPPHVNDCPPGTYKAQVDGKLCEITDSVFYNNLAANAYTTATSVGVFNAGNNNVTAASSPIQSITRGAPVVKGGLTMVPVTFLDPRPKNDATSSVGWAPEDGFFSSTKYRGAFDHHLLWIAGWTASQAYGLTPDDPTANPWCDLGNGLAGVAGDPILSGFGDLSAGGTFTIQVRNAVPNKGGILIVGLAELNLGPFLGGTLVPTPDFFFTGLPPTNANGFLSLATTWPSGIPSGFEVVMQRWQADAMGGSKGFSATNGLKATQP